MKQIVSMFFIVFFSCAFFSCAKEVNNVNSQKNSTIETILSRKSVRKYSDKKISQDQIDVILKAAMAAPSAMNKQPWELIVVTDKTKLEEIGKLLPKAVYAKESQVTFIVCGNIEKSDIFWAQDCSAVTENILLAAESLGIGAVWCAGYPIKDRMEPIKQFFNLPENIIPLSIIPMGYPLIQEEPKQKFDIAKVHINNW